ELPLRRGNAVDHFLVDGDADGGREAAVALEGRLGPALAEERLHLVVDLLRAHARGDDGGQALHEVGEDLPALPHEPDLAGRLVVDHRPALTARRMPSRIVAMSPSPATVVSRSRSR